MNFNRRHRVLKRDIRVAISMLDSILTTKTENTNALDTAESDHSARTFRAMGVVGVSTKSVYRQVPIVGFTLPDPTYQRPKSCLNFRIQRRPNERIRHKKPHFK